MKQSISYAAIIAAMALAAPAFAQDAASTTMPSTGATSMPTPGATTGDMAPATGPSSPTGSPVVGAGAVLDQDAAASTTGVAGGASAQTGSASDASATVAAGMNVKDSTGATIGQVTEVKPDATGENTATIKMGADTFAVGTSSLAVQGGAAVVNATQAEIKQMMKK